MRFLDVLGVGRGIQRPYNLQCLYVRLCLSVSDTKIIYKDDNTFLYTPLQFSIFMVNKTERNILWLCHCMDFDFIHGVVPGIHRHYNLQSLCLRSGDDGAWLSWAFHFYYVLAYFPNIVVRVSWGGSLVYGAYEQSGRRLLNELSRQRGSKSSPVSHGWLSHDYHTHATRCHNI